MANESFPQAADNSSKGIFSSPDKIISTGIPIIAAAAVIWFFGSSIMDYILGAFENAIHLFVLAVALVLMLTMASDKKLRAALFYLYRGLVRKGWMWLVNQNPIDVRQTYLEKSQETLVELDSGLDKLRGQQRATLGKDQANQSALVKLYEVLRVAKTKEDARSLLINGRQSERLETLAAQYAHAIEHYKMLIDKMARYREICSDTIIDMKGDIAFRKEQLAFSKASHSVIGGMKAIMRGMPEQDMYDAAGEVIDARYGDALGEIDGFMDVTKDILASADMQDMANVQHVIDRLNAMEAKAAEPVKTTVAAPAKAETHLNQ